jgi:choline kinase
MKVVIIAAGMGSRLWMRSQQSPKTLLPFGNGTILSTIVDSFRAIGLDDFVIVVGFNAGEIRDYVRETSFGPGARIVVVENPEWRRGNGVSVLAASEELGNEPFILSMSDHIVTQGALRLVADSASLKNVLLVDRHLERLFDIDDATKVRLDGSSISAIGKELITFDAADCGIFRLNARFMDAMRRQASAGREGISDGVADLISTRDFEAVFIGAGHEWHDLDTPEAYQHAVERAEVWSQSAS